MHPMDAKILPTEGVEEGRVVIHPHSNEAYVFFDHEWHVMSSGAEDTKRETRDEAYKRAMEDL